MQRRFVFALIAAGLIVGAGGIFAWYTQLLAARRYAEAVEAAGHPFPQGFTPQIEVPESEIEQLAIGSLFIGRWYVVIPVVVLGCLGAATLVGRLRRSWIANKPSDYLSK